MANLSNINGKFVVEQTTGYVGVGTTDPNYPIEVLNASAEIALNASGGSTYRIQSDSASNFIIRKEGVGDRFVINSAGNATFSGKVGIGTAPTSRDLSVFRSTAGSVANFLHYTDASNFAGLYIGVSQSSQTVSLNASGSSGGNFEFQCGNATALSLTSSNATFAGNVAIQSTIPKLSFTDLQQDDWDIINDNGEFKFLCSTGSGVALQLNTNNNATFAGTISVQGSGASYLTGNVGIGTTVPANKLQVNAASAIADTLILKLDGGAIGFSGNNDANIKHGLVFDLCSYNSSTGVVQRQAAKIEVQKVGSWNESAGGSGTKADIVFSTNNGTIATPAMVEKMRIQSDGNVGIGTDSPTNKLDVFAANNFEGIALTDSAETLFSIKKSGSSVNTGFMDLLTEGVGTVRIHADNVSYFNGGNVGINTTSPTEKLHVEGRIRLGSTPVICSHDNIGIDIDQNNNSGSNYFRVTRDGEATELFRVQENGNVGIGTTLPLSLSANTSSLSINSTRTDLTGGLFLKANDVSKVQLYWGTDGFVNEIISGSAIWYTGNTERMRITSGGDVLIGTGNVNPGQNNTSTGTQISSGGRLMMQNSGSDNIMGRNTDGVLLSFRRAGVEVGSISITTTATTYTTSSDYRLKEDLQDFAGLDMVSKIPVYDFKWKTDESRSYGVMAHELQEVLPDAVSGEKDAEEMQGVDYSKIVPLLVKSIQELKADNDSLKARIETLENN